MEFILRNWRCIESLNIRLAPVTILIGRNASGKSSTLYALYFLTRVFKMGSERVNDILRTIYGADLSKIARIDNGRSNFPVEIMVKNEYKSMRFLANDINEVVLEGESIWNNAYLLPSYRLSLLKSLQYVDRVLSTTMKPEDLFILSFVKPFVEMLSKLYLLPPAPFFLEDMQRIFGGIGVEERIFIEKTGSLKIRVLPISFVREFEYVDEAIGQSFPADLAPDGALDLLLIKAFLKKMSENELLLIEEPEIHKNPLMLLDIADYIAESVKRGACVVCSTHSDIFVHAIARVFKDPSKVAIYYLERSKESPWTTAREIKVYEDGTIEEFPGAEEILARLF